MLTCYWRKFARLQYVTLGEWLYYLADGSGYVRQGADEQGQVVDSWLFDPDGSVLASAARAEGSSEPPGVRRGV